MQDNSRKLEQEGWQVIDITLGRPKKTVPQLPKSKKSAGKHKVDAALFAVPKTEKTPETPHAERATERLPDERSLHNATVPAAKQSHAPQLVKMPTPEYTVQAEKKAPPEGGEQPPVASTSPAAGPAPNAAEPEKKTAEKPTERVQNFTPETSTKEKSERMRFSGGDLGLSLKREYVAEVAEDVEPPAEPIVKKKNTKDETQPESLVGVTPVPHKVKVQPKKRAARKPRFAIFDIKAAAAAQALKDKEREQLAEAQAAAREKEEQAEREKMPAPQEITLETEMPAKPMEWQTYFEITDEPAQQTEQPQSEAATPIEEITEKAESKKSEPKQPEQAEQLAQCEAVHNTELPPEQPTLTEDPVRVDLAPAAPELAEAAETAEIASLVKPIVPPEPPAEVEPTAVQDDETSSAEDEVPLADASEEHDSSAEPAEKSVDDQPQDFLEIETVTTEEPEPEALPEPELETPHTEEEKHAEVVPDRESDATQPSEAEPEHDRITEVLSEPEPNPMLTVEEEPTEATSEEKALEQPETTPADTAKESPEQNREDEPANQQEEKPETQLITGEEPETPQDTIPAKDDSVENKAPPIQATPLTTATEQTENPGGESPEEATAVNPEPQPAQPAQEKTVVKPEESAESPITQPEPPAPEETTEKREAEPEKHEKPPELSTENKTRKNRKGLFALPGLIAATVSKLSGHKKSDEDILLVPESLEDPPTEQAPAEQPEPLTEQPPAEQPEPPIEQPPAEQPDPPIEQPPAEQPDPPIEQPPTEQPEPLTEQPPAEQPEPLTDQPPVEQPETLIEQPLVEQPEPLAEQPADEPREDEQSPDANPSEENVEEDNEPEQSEESEEFKITEKSQELEEQEQQEDTSKSAINPDIPAPAVRELIEILKQSTELTTPDDEELPPEEKIDEPLPLRLAAVEEKTKSKGISASPADAAKKAAEKAARRAAMSMKEKTTLEAAESSRENVAAREPADKPTLSTEAPAAEDTPEPAQAESEKATSAVNEPVEPAQTSPEKDAADAVSSATVESPKTEQNEKTEQTEQSEKTEKSDAAQPASAERKKKFPLWAKILSGLLFFLLLLVALAYLYLNGKLNLIRYNDGTISSAGDVAQTEDQDLDSTGLQQNVGSMVLPASDPFESEDVLNILLISTDERTDAVNDKDAFTHLNELDGTKNTTEFSEDARADSLILVSLNVKEDTIKLVSIERGTGVPIDLPAYQGQYDWITHTFRYGGARLTMNTVEKCFGVQVDHYVRINFNSFVQIVDAVGGIDLNLTDMEAKALNWEVPSNSMLIVNKVDPGWNHFDGYTALQYARLRKIDNDWQRVARQRTVIQAVLNQVKSSSVVELDGLLTAVLPLVQTNFTKSEITALLPQLPAFLGVDTQQMSLPAQGSYGVRKGMDGRLMFDPDWGVNSRILQRFFYGITSDKDVRNYLLDNSGVPDWDEGLTDDDFETADYSIFLAGETEGLAVNDTYKQSLLKYLHEKQGVNVLLADCSYGTGLLLNDYVTTGNIEELEQYMQWCAGTPRYTEEEEAFWKWLYRYNTTQSQKIMVIGIGSAQDEQQADVAMKALALLLQSNSKIPKDLRDLAKEVRDGKENTIEKLNAALDADYYHTRRLFSNDNWPLAKHLLAGVASGTEKLNNNGENNASASDAMMIEFAFAQQLYPNEKFFGQLDSTQVLQCDTSLTTNSFATQLCGQGNSVCSILPMYMTRRAPDEALNPFEFAEKNPIRAFMPAALSRDTLVSVAGPASPYQERNGFFADNVMAAELPATAAFQKILTLTETEPTTPYDKEHDIQTPETAATAETATATTAPTMESMIDEAVEAATAEGAKTPETAQREEKRTETTQDISKIPDYRQFATAETAMTETSTDENAVASSELVADYAVDATAETATSEGAKTTETAQQKKKATEASTDKVKIPDYRKLATPETATAETATAETAAGEIAITRPQAGRMPETTQQLKEISESEKPTASETTTTNAKTAESAKKEFGTSVGRKK